MSSTADSIIIKRWFNERTLPYSADSEKFLRGLRVTSIEDLKLLTQEQFSELFKGESAIAKQKADLAFQELGKCSTAALVQVGRAEPKATISPDAAKLPVLIVGAGIGGISSAIALSDIGLKSIVLDRRSDDQLLDGAGINLQAEAIEALNSLGVSTKTMLREGNVISKQSYYLPDGRHVCSIDKKASSESSIPKQVAIHRGKLIELLLNVASRRDSIQLRTNHCVREVHQESPCSKQGSIDIIADSTMSSHPVGTTPVALSGSMVLGADGINSNIRKKYIFTEGKDPLCFHGVTHYRGLVEDYPTFLDGHTMVLIGGLNIKVVAYPITEPQDGLQRLNWIVAVKEEEANPDKSAHQNFLVRLLSNHGFNPDFIDLKSMITNTSSIQAWPMVDLKPLPCWINGRIALVGDSAHAMLPVGSTGSLAALLDSLALREAFQKSGMVTVNDVLSLYEQMRYKSASLHQQKCKLQPAESEVQSVMDTFTAGEVIPQEYAERIQVAMKKLHNPSQYLMATSRDVNVKNHATVAQLRLTGVDAKPGVAKSTIKSNLSSLIVMMCSLAVPITLHARKSLLPVGFPSASWPLKIVRYMMFWIHTLGLSYFYSAKTGFRKSAIVIVMLIGCMEINGYLTQKVRVEALQDLLTSESEASTFKSPISKKPCKRRSMRSSTMIVATCMPIIVGVLALFLQMAQKGLFASAFKCPSNKRVVLKKQHNEATWMMLTTKAGGNLLEELSKLYHFSPVERVALTCSGSLQQMLSSYHLQSCQVEVKTFDIMEVGVDIAGSDGSSPLAVYDREVNINIADKTLCNAKSKVRVYNKELLEVLSSNSVGIGQLLKLYHLHHEFQLHDAGRMENGEMWRFYSLECEGMIGFDILEEFAIDAWN